jgi:hypothetical protein
MGSHQHLSLVDSHWVLNQHFPEVVGDAMPGSSLHSACTDACTRDRWTAARRKRCTSVNGKTLFPTPTRMNCCPPKSVHTACSAEASCAAVSAASSSTDIARPPATAKPCIESSDAAAAPHRDSASAYSPSACASL